MRTLDDTMAGMRAAAEPTRLRILALCADGDLTVSELVRILGQSQPRISRHLKVLTAAGLLTRIPEGSWVFHRLAQDGAQTDLAARLVDLAPLDDEVFLRDRERLVQIKRERSEEAAAYFRDNAEQWDSLRSLHVDDAVVEKAILALAPEHIERHLDLGTGTGRILELLAERSELGQGVDQSREMLAVARANLDSAGLSHCQVRQADITQLPFPAETFDLVTLHQVLHFLPDPARAIEAATQMLRPGGTLLIVDFAPHEEENLRRDHQHRRLGFSDHEAEAWLKAAGLTPRAIRHLNGDPLTVTLWSAVKLAAANTDATPVLAKSAAGRTLEKTA
jgi:ArsR family transcriptional regulator